MHLSVIFKYVEYYENKLSSLLFLNAAVWPPSLQLAYSAAHLSNMNYFSIQGRNPKRCENRITVRKEKKEKGKNTYSVQSAASSEHLG